MSQPAKSAKLQLLQKNPNKKNTKVLKRQAEAEERLRMKSDEINAPSWLDSTGKKTFEFLKQELLSVEIIENPDTYALALYADAYSQYAYLKKQLKKLRNEHKKQYKLQEQEFLEYGTPITMTAELIGNPLIKQMDTCAKNIRSFGADLGLTPAARTKLAKKLTTDKVDDDDY
ncbi:phage terminase small subunit P27 family [Enterococcus hulanensis]|uniref:phage terminase small subunit P27 family n=1 Tax=Enterococcus hulanensis TaxID=2559929 RepID=UPI002891BA30|nr:phage terminase small subunit P27 family [Enterococcus hulanensis]MDT2660693.1 phage terminase small subunit P27 family [Enterococcus hulanensis]